MNTLVNKNIVTFLNNESSLSIEFLGLDTLRIYKQKVKTDLIELSYKKANPINITGNQFKYLNYVIKVNDNFDLSIYHKDVLVVNISHNEEGINYPISKDSVIYGLGDKMCSMNKKGYYFRQWNTDDSNHQDELFPSLYKSINFVLNYSNSHYYGIFLPSTYPYEVDISHKTLNHIYCTSKYVGYDYFLFLGDSPKEIISHYSSLVGHPYFIRMKMLGNNQSRWSYENEEQIRAVVEGFKKANIPLDYIHYDIHYMDGYRDFTVDKSRFPDMKSLNAYLNKNHIDAIPINDSGLKYDEEYSFFKYCKENDLISTYEGKEFVGIVWPGEAVFPKYYSPLAREKFGQLAYDFIKEYGFSGIWNDMNEPVSFKGELPEDVDFSIKGRKLKHIEEHNVYGEHMIRCYYNIFEKDNVRPYIFSRAAFATTPKYAFVWNGDNFSLWHHLKLCIPQILSMSISGAMFNGCDVGGFGSDCNKELLIRWTQANVLMPFFRNHSNLNSKAQEPYAYDKELEDIYRHYINIRYEFIPYLYTLVNRMSTKGEPIVRPVFYNYPNDKNVLEINDQYMVGDNVLVAPIVDQGARSRIVYFPEGAWIDYETKQKYKGGKSYIIEMNLQKTGIYIKNNCIIPVFEKLNYIDRKEITTIGFKVFGNKGTVEVYDDDGVSLDYKNKIFNVYKVSYSNNKFKFKIVKNRYQTPYKNIKLEVNGKSYTFPFKDLEEIIPND